MNDERLELLLAISRRTLGIESFELTGKQTLDLHVVCVEDLAHALEAAYDAGLLIGHRMGREACPQNC
jgi:hypothetical protein